MISYAKLRSGAWGVRVQGDPAVVGAIVTVTKRSGETKSETISEIVWQGEGVALCAIHQTARRGGGRGGQFPRSYRPRPYFVGRCEDAPCCGCCG